jgi:hypothetical protein
MGIVSLRAIGTPLPPCASPPLAFGDNQNLRKLEYVPVGSQGSPAGRENKHVRISTIRVVAALLITGNCTWAECGMQSKCSCCLREPHVLRLNANNLVYCQE